MTEVLKFRDYAFLKKCKKAEYSAFTTRFVGATMAVGLETLNVPEALFTQYQARKAVLTDLVAMSRVANETGKINELETKIYNLLKYMLSDVRNSRTTPLAQKREAGTTLYNATRVYLKLYKQPQQQKLELVGGLLHDLTKPELSQHVETLGLMSELEQLTLLHAQLTVLLDSRTNTQLLNSEENSRAVRHDMDILFEMITGIIWAYSLTNPSEEITAYIKQINKFLAETETAYNQRMAQSGRKEKENENESEEAPEDSSPQEDEVTQDDPTQGNA